MSYSNVVPMLVHLTVRGEIGPCGEMHLPRGFFRVNIPRLRSGQASWLTPTVDSEWRDELNGRWRGSARGRLHRVATRADMESARTKYHGCAATCMETGSRRGGFVRRRQWGGRESAGACTMHPYGSTAMQVSGDMIGATEHGGF